MANDGSRKSNAAADRAAPAKAATASAQLMAEHERQTNQSYGQGGTGSSAGSYDRLVSSGTKQLSK